VGGASSMGPARQPQGTNDRSLISFLRTLPSILAPPAGLPFSLLLYYPPLLSLSIPNLTLSLKIGLFLSLGRRRDLGAYWPECYWLWVAKTKRATNQRAERLCVREITCSGAAL
jgi:hypothetical protein